jgi:hypothetical protein
MLLYAFQISYACRQGEEGLVDVRRAVGNFSAKKAAERAKGEGSDDDGHIRRKKGRQGRVKNRRVPKKPLPTKGGVKKRKGTKK